MNYRMKWSRSHKESALQAHIIHEHFYCNCRYAATTSLDAWPSAQVGGLAARSVNGLFQVYLPSLRLRAPVSHGVLAVSSRTVMNNVG